MLSKLSELIASFLSEIIPFVPNYMGGKMVDVTCWAGGPYFATGTCLQAYTHTHAYIYAYIQ